MNENKYTIEDVLALIETEHEGQVKNHPTPQKLEKYWHQKNRQLMAEQMPGYMLSEDPEQAVHEMALALRLKHENIRISQLEEAGNVILEKNLGIMLEAEKLFLKREDLTPSERLHHEAKAEALASLQRDEGKAELERKKFKDKNRGINPQKFKVEPLTANKPASATR